MKRLTAMLLTALSLVAASAQPVKDRIIYNDPSNYRTLTAVHAGAGQMAFTQLIGRSDLATNFLYLHSGVINAKSGIGHHFHHTIQAKTIQAESTMCNYQIQISFDTEENRRKWVANEQQIL